MDKQWSEVNNPEGLHKMSAVELAVAAVDGNASPMDLDDLDPAPTALDPPREGDDRFTGETCSNPPCTRRAVDECIICGQPLCEDCAGHG